MAGILPAMAAACGVLLLSSCGGCDATVNHAALPTYFSSPGAFDDVEIDQAAHRLYVADRGHSGVTVIDISGSTPRFAGTVDVGGSPNGLAVAPDLKRVFAGLASGAVVAIDTDPASKTFMKVVDGISVDKAEADLMDYSAKAKLLFVGTGVRRYRRQRRPDHESSHGPGRLEGRSGAAALRSCRRHAVCDQS